MNFIFDSGVIIEKLLVSMKALVLQRDGRETAKKDLEHSMFSCPVLLIMNITERTSNPLGYC
jgi:hypothetical protein